MTEPLDIAPLRRALLDVLGSRPSALRRQQAAQVLRDLAMEQMRLAEAENRSGVLVRAEQVLETQRPGSKGGRPKGSGAKFISVAPGVHRIDGGSGRSPRLLIGRWLYPRIGSPERLHVYREGSKVFIRKPQRLAETEASYSVSQPKQGMPGFSVGYERLRQLRLEEGKKYDASIENNAIVIILPE